MPQRRLRAARQHADQSRVRRLHQPVDEILARGVWRQRAGSESALHDEARKPPIRWTNSPSPSTASPAKLKGGASQPIYVARPGQSQFPAGFESGRRRASWARNPSTAHGPCSASSPMPIATPTPERLHVHLGGDPAQPAAADGQGPSAGLRIFVDTGGGPAVFSKDFLSTLKCGGRNTLMEHPFARRQIRSRGIPGRRHVAGVSREG